MKKLVHEIRQQPLHIRKTFAIVMTTLTFFVIVFFWARSTQSNVVAILGGSKNTTEQTNIAKQSSPFVAIKQSFKDLSATIGGFWSVRNEFSPSKFRQSTVESQVSPNTLPTSTY